MENVSLLTSTEGKYLDDTYYVYHEAPDFDNTLQKKLVVFIHGIGGNFLSFDELSSAIEMRGFSTLRYDLMGRGQSKYPKDSNFGEEAHVSQLRRLIIELGIQTRYGKYHLIGHSMGGSLAACYSAMYLDEISSISFLAPAGLMDLGPIAMLRNGGCCLRGIIKPILRSSQESAWKKDFMDQNSPAAIRAVDTSRELSKLNPLIFEAFWNSVLQFPLSGIEDKIKSIDEYSDGIISVLLLAAGNDSAVPFDPNYQRWNKLFSGRLRDRANKGCYKTVVYQDYGHGFFIENGAVVAADILNFLTETDLSAMSDSM